MPVLPTDATEVPNYTAAEHATHHNIVHELNNNLGDFTQSATAPTTPLEGDLWLDTAEYNLKRYTGSTWQVLRALGLGRGTAVHTTAALLDDEDEEASVVLGRGYRLLRVSTSVPARVRLYDRAAQQAADLTRPVDTDPQGDHGVVLDFVTTPSLLGASLSPIVNGASMEAIPDANIPITVTNLSGASGAVSVTLTYVVTE